MKREIYKYRIQSRNSPQEKKLLSIPGMVKYIYSGNVFKRIKIRYANATIFFYLNSGQVTFLYMQVEVLLYA